MRNFLDFMLLVLGLKARADIRNGAEKKELVNPPSPPPAPEEPVIIKVRQNIACPIGNNSHSKKAEFLSRRGNRRVATIVARNGQQATLSYRGGSPFVRTLVPVA